MTSVSDSVACPSECMLDYVKLTFTLHLNMRRLGTPTDASAAMTAYGLLLSAMRSNIIMTSTGLSIP